MRVSKLPADAKLVFDNLYITPSGDAYAHTPSTNEIKTRADRVGEYTKYKPRINDNGYLATTHKKKNYTIHRLIAAAFIPNPELKEHINHKDSDKTNCSISNLEWCTPSENQIHAYREGGRKHLQKKVLQLTLDGDLIKEHDSIIQAAEAVGGNRVSISAVCRGKNRMVSHKGFKWEYA